MDEFYGWPTESLTRRALLGVIIVTDVVASCLMPGLTVPLIWICVTLQECARGRIRLEDVDIPQTLIIAPVSIGIVLHVAVVALTGDRADYIPLWARALWCRRFLDAPSPVKDCGHDRTT